MPNSFLICYPDIPQSALVVTTSATMNTDYPIESSFYGRRHNYSQLATSGNSLVVTYDLGTGNTRTIDHLIVGGAQVMLSQAAVTGIYVDGSNNGSTWNAQLGTAANFLTRTFNGPDSDDLIFTLAYNDTRAGTLAAYRYFRVTFTAGSATSIPFSKLYFGASFDMGVEPSTYDMEVITDQDSDTWKFHRGQVLMTKAFYPKHRFTVEWDGVTDAKATAFKTTILNNPYRDYVWLYAATYADPLYDNKLVYCKVVDEECSVEKQKDNWNVVKCVFEESI
jgi:hypothetical protein